MPTNLPADHRLSTTYRFIGNVKDERKVIEAQGRRAAALSTPHAAAVTSRASAANVMDTRLNALSACRRGTQSILPPSADRTASTTLSPEVKTDMSPEVRRIISFFCLGGAATLPA